MKYRFLTKEEMEIFDEDFKHFMITNGVTNEEWLEWNKSDLEKATQLVEVFSDTVLQKVYEKIKFILKETTQGALDKKSYYYRAMSEDLKEPLVVKRGNIEYTVTKKITVMACSGDHSSPSA